MARILFINTVCNGSTGTICKNLYKLAEKHGYECCIAYGRGDEPSGFNTIKIGSNIDVYYHAFKARVFDSCGFDSKKATRKFLAEIDKFQPDIIHLHNIHGYYLNIELLFEYLWNHPEIKKIWTLHDSWAYTGHCAYYLSNRCYKWKEHCNNCKYLSMYPKSVFDNSFKNYQRKRNCFSNINNMIVVCVSKWLRDEVKESFLSKYRIEEVASGIDLNNFRERTSDFKQAHNISQEKKVILGVAQVWDERKGLKDFVELREKISNQYVIVLVGLNEKQIRQLPEGIIGISRTKTQVELAEIYSMADVFFNPTKEETFGLTNVEAQACGTMTCSYDAGGTKETLINNNAYIVNDVTDFIALLEKNGIVELADQNEVRNYFDAEKRFMGYIQLYNDILKGED